jgi:CHAT domain-containing protein/tetratricopeptide (TPR) repeat protein
MSSGLVSTFLMGRGWRQRKLLNWKRNYALVRPKQVLTFFLSMTTIGLSLSSQRLSAQQEATPATRREQFSVNALAARPQSTVVAKGTTLERNLKGGDEQTFTFELLSGQYLYAEVEQKGIDLVLALRDPAGKILTKIDSPNGPYGPEPIVWLADAPGKYLLDVRAPNSKAPAGDYTLTVRALGEPTITDRNRVLAARTFQEAQDLRAQRTAPSRLAAIEKYKEAQTLFALLGDHYWKALTLHAIGSTHAQSGEVRKALLFFDQALPEFRAIGDKRREASVLNFIGGLRDVLGDLPLALQHYRQALGIYAEIGDLFNRASVINNIGKIYFDTADWQQALFYYNQTPSIFHSFGDQRREAITLNNIGLVYNSLGDLQRALFFADRSIRLSRAIGDKVGEADSLDLLGNASLQLGQAQKAFEYLGQGLPLRRAIGSPREEALTRGFLGGAYAALNQRAKALEEHQEALRLFRGVGDRRLEGIALFNIGSVHELLHEKHKATENYKEALSIFRGIEDLHNAARALVGIARVGRQQGDLPGARHSVEEALSLIEKVRARAGAQDNRASFFASKRDAYELYIDLLVQQHRLDPALGLDAAALQASERARARSLLELLNEAQVDIREGVNPALIERERAISQMVSAKAQRQTQLLGQKSSQDQVTQLNKDLRALEDEYEQVQVAIRQASPEYAALTQPQPLSLKEIQQQLDRETVLLEYSLGDERSYLWLITSDSLKTYELPARDKIQKVAELVYKSLTARSIVKSLETASQRQERIAQADVQFQAAAMELSRIVLAPAAAELGTKRLVVVADGALQYVPFSALSVVGGQRSVAQPVRLNNGPRTSNKGSLINYRPLILDHEMVSLPSASALAVQRRTLANRKPAPRGVAVIADPVFSTRDPRFKTGLKSREVLETPDATSATIDTRRIEHLADNSSKFSIRRLPFTRKEGEQILAVAPGAANMMALDFRANRSTATSEELSKYRYVHFATHGYLDSEQPGLSAIVLSLIDKEGRPQDGFLRAREIYNLKLPAELVVLSACETGLGKEVRGEGLVGLTRGFMYAGARRVVVSLWNVNDKATAELMMRFYRGMLRDNKTPSAALRAAQVALLADQQRPSPYYWAAFVLQGEWR